MPLKVICKSCGKVMLEVDMVNDNFSVPDLIYEKLQKQPNTSQPRCPHCKRVIKSEDIDPEVWANTLEITGQKADISFFSKLGSRVSKEFMGFKVFSTSKKKHKITSNYLRVGHDESTKFW